MKSEEKSISGRRKCKYKGPDVEVSLTYLKNTQEARWLSI